MLNKQEKREVREITRSINKQQLLSNGGPTEAHLAHRRFKTKDGKIWVYYIPDFSEFVKDYFMAVMKKIGTTLDLENKIQIESEKIGKSFLATKFYKNFVPDTVEEEIRKNPEYLGMMTEKYETLIDQINIELGEAEYAIKRGKFAEIDLKRLFDVSTSFTSLNMDKFFPYKMLDKIISKAQKNFSIDDKIIWSNPVNILFTPPSGISCYMQTHEGLLDLAEQALIGEKPNIEKFIEETGYVGTNDIMPAKLEDKDLVEEKIRVYLKDFPTLNHIYEEKEKIKFKRRLIRLKQQQLIDKILDKLPKEKQNFAYSLCKFATVVSECNERRRFAVTRTYRVFRKVLQHKGYDLMNTSYQEIVR